MATLAPRRAPRAPQKRPSAAAAPGYGGVSLSRSSLGFPSRGEGLCYPAAASSTLGALAGGPLGQSRSTAFGGRSAPQRVLLLNDEGKWRHSPCSELGRTTYTPRNLSVAALNQMRQSFGGQSFGEVSPPVSPRKSALLLSPRAAAAAAAGGAAARSGERSPRRRLQYRGSASWSAAPGLAAAWPAHQLNASLSQVSMRSNASLHALALQTSMLDGVESVERVRGRGEDWPSPGSHEATTCFELRSSARRAAFGASPGGASPRVRPTPRGNALRDRKKAVVPSKRYTGDRSPVAARSPRRRYGAAVVGGKSVRLV